MKNKYIAVIAALLAVAVLFGCTRAGSKVTAEDLTLTEFSISEMQTVQSTSKKEQSETVATTHTTSKTKKETTAAPDTTAGSTANKKTSHTSKSTTAKSTTKHATTSSARSTTQAARTTEKKDASHCKITIQCLEVLDNLDKLADGHEFYVPKSGYFISGYSVEYREGDTVYDVIKRVCRECGIKMTAKPTVYGMYVVGLNNLDEKDCGGTSGWTYYVDGEFPMVACDKYQLSGGETIEFKYVV
ncbi:MAG: DUF4430 domain-containing protein [Ruminococcaceae bacterium]|nr:DUF4430 domain-containing protein [Oscillospiraceae bacterium]